MNAHIEALNIELSLFTNRLLPVFRNL